MLGCIEGMLVDAVGAAFGIEKPAGAGALGKPAGDVDILAIEAAVVPFAEVDA